MMMFGLDLGWTDAVEGFAAEVAMSHALPFIDPSDVEGHVPAGLRADISYFGGDADSDAVAQRCLMHYDHARGSAVRLPPGTDIGSFRVAHYHDYASWQQERADLDARINSAYDRMQDSWDRCTDVSWEDAAKAAAVGAICGGAVGAVRGAACYGAGHIIEHAPDAYDAFWALDEYNRGVAEAAEMDANIPAN